MKKNIFLCLLAASCLMPLQAQNMWQRSARGIAYGVEAQVSTSDGDTPLWLNANRYGLSSVDNQYGYLRASLHRDAERDSTSRWRLGYGIDVAAGYGLTSTAVLHQLYADLDFRLVRLTVGAKEQPMELKNQELSTGSQTFGINSRPVPQVRIGLPRYWNISGKGHWAAIKGYIAYGMQTDGRFLRDYLNEGSPYSRHVLYHAKAGYLKLGNEQKFPVTFEGGLEMATQFGGTTYNVQDWAGIHVGTSYKQPHDFHAFWNATFGTGGDATDGAGYANATGNTVGSWLFRLNYQGKGWHVSAYLDHFFDDHSQMFLEYGWRDGLWGIEIGLPKNRIVDNIVYEYMRTDYQSGPIYHDHTPEMPEQISGKDSYYNHNLYVGWQHWGQASGNPLYVSPLYFHNGYLFFQSNRFRTHHIGISGTPLPSLHYRLLFTHERSVGDYDSPYDPARRLNSFMAEVNYSPSHLGRLNTKGWSIAAALGIDRGKLIGDNTGFQLTIRKTGLLTHE